MKSNCLECKIEFNVRPSRIKKGVGKFCSKNCHYLFKTGKKISEQKRKRLDLKSTAVEKKCLVCGLKFKVRKCREAKAQFCSYECKGFYQHKNKTNKGIKNGMWKGGVASLNAIIRSSIEARLWKKACLERDNYTCQKTGQRGGKLVVHHINNFADFPELRTSIENGITLSVEIHREFHHKYGVKNNTKIQLLEFLNPKI